MRDGTPRTAMQLTPQTILPFTRMLCGYFSHQRKVVFEGSAAPPVEATQQYCQAKIQRCVAEAGEPGLSHWLFPFRTNFRPRSTPVDLKDFVKPESADPPSLNW